MDNDQAPRFGFCVHSHQPAGNSETVLEEVFTKAYRPFFEVMDRHREVNFNAHFSGYLLEWLQRDRPEYVDMLRRMVDRGQLEILGGGFYEPILASVPERDGVGQIHQYAEKLQEIFGIKPRGMWLAERVWEPHFPRILEKAGIEYTLEDYLGFLNAGIPKEEISGYYSVEFEGSVTRVFPINLELRDSIPFSGHVSAVNSIVRVSGQNSGRLGVFGDDCEKFGAWPGTYDLSYRKNWIEKFLRLAERKGVETWKLSDYMDSFTSSGQVYLPSCSYPEMMRWAMNPSSQRKVRRLLKDPGIKGQQFIMGAPWRNFLTRYAESKQLYWKIKFVSTLVAEAGEDEEMLRFLYRGEANDALWHGVFGGIYLPILRMNSYSSLIRAQVLAEEKSGKVEYADTFAPDTEGNSSALSTGHLWAAIDHTSGLELSELDYRKKGYNVMDTVTRMEEAYHASLARVMKKGQRTDGRIDSGIYARKPLSIGSIVYDLSPRRSFRDRLFSTRNEVYRGESSSAPKIRNASSPQYIASDDHFGVFRDYHIVEGEHMVKVGKKILLERRGPTAMVEYSIEDLDNLPRHYVFGSEITLSSLALDGSHINVNGKSLDSIEEKMFGGAEIAVDYPSRGLRISVNAHQADRTLVYPVRTVSNSEAGLETILQGVCILPFSEPGKTPSLKISIAVEGE